MSVNKVILVGNVGRDPEIRAMGNGSEVASFSLATTDSWKDKQTGERKTKTEWHNIVVFSQGLVNVIRNYVHKGSKLYVEGALQTRKWTDNSGVEKYRTEIVLQGFNGTIQMLDGRNSSGSFGGDQGSSAGMSGNGGQMQQAPSNNQMQNESNDEMIDDDIPF